MFFLFSIRLAESDELDEFNWIQLEPVKHDWKLLKDVISLLHTGGSVV